jgi:hypothetical protein
MPLDDDLFPWEKPKRRRVKKTRITTTVSHSEHDEDDPPPKKRRRKGSGCGAFILFVIAFIILIDLLSKHHY